MSNKTIIIVLGAAILVVAGILFASRQKGLSPVTTPTTTTGTQDTTLSDIQKQGTSDEIPDMEKDLNATDFTFIDSDLGNIETEIDVALR